MQYVIALVAILFVAETFGNPKLLFANRKDIRVINFQKGKLIKSILVKDVNDAASVDYYFRKQEVCWTDIGNEFIKCVSLNGTNEKSKLQDIKIISRGITSPDGMAIDWLTEKIYWADSEAEKIEVAELYGPNRKVLYWKDLDQPRAIALVPSEGIMFWSDWGENPKLERAGMDGGQLSRKVIVDKDILWPNGLTVDYESRKIFWADGKHFSISAVDFDGSNRVKVVENLKHPFALTYFRQTLYWTDWRTEGIHYCHLNSQTQCEREKQFNLKLSPMYIHVYDQSRQAHSPTACHHNNGGCSHLCLLAPAPRNFTCACPTGVNLIDKFNCDKGPNNMLLLARRSDIRRISLDTPDRTPVVLPVSNVQHAIAVDYDPVDGFFYWTDDEAFLIQRARLNGSDQEVLIHSDGLDSDGVAIDWLARNLYWSDAKNNRIEVARLDGSSRKILLRGGLDEPRAIALYPEGGLMFWTDWGNHSKIERSFLDGSNRKTIVNTNLGWPNGVAIDHQEYKVYWVDARTQVIEVSELDGRNRRVILGENLPHVFGFSLLGDFLYWTDWQKRSIERVHKHNETFREVLVDQLPDVMGLKALSVSNVIGHSPCMKNNGDCSHLCFNRPNYEYVCDCPLGYELSPNGRSCVIPSAFLLFGHKNDRIVRVSLETFASTTLPVPNVNQPVSIDNDMYNRLYWCDATSKTIKRSFMNGTEPEIIVQFDLSSPESVAVDWVVGNLYWADSESNRIEMSRLDGTFRKAILWNVTSPKSLSVDPIYGNLYWSEWRENDNQIMRANLDGSSSAPFIRNIERTKDIDINLMEKRIYWLDVDGKKIESADFDGQNKKVHVNNLYKPNTFAQYENFLFWYDEKLESIIRNPKDSAEKAIIMNETEAVTDLIIFQSIRSRAVKENPCLKSNGNCSQLCIYLPSSPKAYVCACKTHYTLSDDAKTCLPPPSFLIFSKKSSVTRLLSDENQCPTFVLPIPNLRNVQAITFDPTNNILLWIDSRAQIIRKANQNGARTGVLVKQESMIPFDLVIDPTNQLVYWSCASSDIINVTKLDGSQVGTVLGFKKNSKPRSLALHYKLGLLFYTNLAIPPTIEKLPLSGLIPDAVIEGGLKSPTTIEVDSVDDILFWGDVNPSVIWAADLNGQNRRILVDTELLQPQSLAVHENYLYWIDAEQKVIEKVNKFDGQEREKILSKAAHLTDIISFGPHLLQFSRDLPCLKEGKKCSHMCFDHNVIENTFKYSFLMPLKSFITYGEDFRSGYEKSSKRLFFCECPLGMVLSQNGYTCLPKSTCPSNQFTCLSAQNCIPMQWRCDGLKECSDGSDELNCSPMVCDPSFFRCSSGECIENSLVCDRTPHCTDSSDEVECCPPGEALCKSTGHCVSCASPKMCPESLGECPFPITHLPDGEDEPSNAPYIVGAFASLVVLICVVVVAVVYRRRPTLIDEGETESQALKEARSRQYRVVMSGGKVYTGVRGELGPHCLHNQPVRVIAGPELCPNVVNVIERTQVTGASSSSSSMTHYPRETMNPPPTPVVEPRNHCPEAHRCYSAHAVPPTNINSYRHYKTHNRPPPPTPCSTDICDDSDFYSSAVVSPQNSRCFSPPSTCYSSPPPTDYDSDPLPPPPTPTPLTSCPPSPSTDRSYFIRAPCPTPLSNSLSD